MAAQNLNDATVIKSPAGAAPPGDSAPIAAGAVPGAPAMPARLGVFRLIEKIGEGAFGAVYRAEDESLRRPAAVKVLAVRGLAAGHAAQRLETEAQTAAILTHPNIVAIYAYGDGAGEEPPFIAMEFLAGRDLEHVVAQDGPLAPAAALAHVRAAAGALQFAARKNIIHRDIKPSNIFLTSDGVIKVMDFGLAKRLDSCLKLTLPGQALGTPSYFSPEQGRGETVDLRTDIYSLGCTLFFLLAGRKPFEGKNLTDLVIKHSSVPVALPPEWSRLAGGRLAALLLKMMAKKPEERHQSWDSVIADIAAAEAALTTGGGGAAGGVFTKLRAIIGGKGR